MFSGLGVGATGGGETDGIRRGRRCVATGRSAIRWERDKGDLAHLGGREGVYHLPPARVLKGCGRGQMPSSSPIISSTGHQI